MNGFASAWAVDFEFGVQAGERPVPICVTALNLGSRCLIQRWCDDLDQPPFPIGPDHLYVCFWARAELSCHAALGWPMPTRILDFGVEFRRLTNGLGELKHGRGLLGALIWYGLDAMNAVEKREMIDLILRGGPWTRAERKAILDYNKRDVDALSDLYEPMMKDIVRQPGDLERALLRGRSGAAIAMIEHYGVPIDRPNFDRIKRHWMPMQERLIAAVNPAFGVYEGRTFKLDRFANYLTRNKIPWVYTDTGQLSLEGDVFRERAKLFPQLYPLHELRHAMGQLRLGGLAVGSDDRNRTPIWNFSAVTARNAPSTTEFIFGPSRWIRHLIKPGPGRALAYIDWKFQEIGIAAALSGDEALLEAVRSGEPYLAFGADNGLCPVGAEKRKYAAVRNVCKACMLGTGYGLGAEQLAFQIGCTLYQAKDLLAEHRRTYPTFWAWSDANVDFALQNNFLISTFGWVIQVTEKTRPNTLRNWPMQCNGSEMLRIACCLAIERGIHVVAPVHDALLIESDADKLEEAIETTREAMAQASRHVLAGFELGTDVEIIRHPDRYVDDRGVVMWERVLEAVEGVENGSKR